MKKKYILKKDSWQSEDFAYVYSPVCKTFGKFMQEDDHIRNFTADGEFEYISMISKTRYSTGAKIWLKCSFDSFGAPLIVLADDVKNDGQIKRYGLHFEVVAYENGCNVWKIIPFPEKIERPIATTKIGTWAFKIEEESIVNISLQVEEKCFKIEVNGIEFEVKNDDIPENFHVGFTACEGINRLYEFSVEE